MDSRDWAKYVEANDGLTKPWLLIQWRLQLLQERRHEISAQEYEEALAELHQDLMGMGEWWLGREEEFFGSGSDRYGNDQ
jgi:hypothetical protein